MPWTRKHVYVIPASYTWLLSYLAKSRTLRLTRTPDISTQRQSTFAIETVSRGYEFCISKLSKHETQYTNGLLECYCKSESLMRHMTLSLSLPQHNFHDTLRLSSSYHHHITMSCTIQPQSACRDRHTKKPRFETICEEELLG